MVASVVVVSAAKVVEDIWTRGASVVPGASVVSGKSPEPDPSSPRARMAKEAMRRAYLNKPGRKE